MCCIQSVNYELVQYKKRVRNILYYYYFPLLYFHLEVCSFVYLFSQNLVLSLIHISDGYFYPLEINFGGYIVVTRSVRLSIRPSTFGFRTITPKLGVLPVHKERKNPIDFGSSRSRSKVTFTKHFNLVSC